MASSKSESGSDADLRRAVDFLEKGEWQAAHEIVQKDEESALSCWAHGIVHLMEGDLSNARYWYRRAGRSLPDKPVAEDELEQLRKAAG
jgi:Tfp pilus assembly protein PilF